MVHKDLYENAIRIGGRDVFQIHNKAKYDIAIERSVSITLEHLMELCTFYIEACCDDNS